MAVLSYNLSPTLISHLKTIVELRRKILLTPIPPRTELRLKWEAGLERVYWSLNLSGTQASKPTMIKLLSLQKVKRLSDAEKEIVNYKNALDYIKHYWLVTPKPVTPTTIKKLYDISCKPTVGPNTNFFKGAKEEISRFLDYLKAGSEHPVIQAGIAQIHILGIAPFSDGNGRTSRLSSYLFLYKNGYDFRELLVLDEYLRRDLVAFRAAIGSVKKYKNLTLWLEYFAKGVEIQLKVAYKNISTSRFKSDLPASYWKLNDRQRKIINILNSPNEQITNKKAQKLFKISQITASRDLTKLTSLGILFSHGKGRSVYYTRV